ATTRPARSDLTQTSSLLTLRRGSGALPEIFVVTVASCVRQLVLAPDGPLRAPCGRHMPREWIGWGDANIPSAMTAPTLIGAHSFNNSGGGRVRSRSAQPLVMRSWRKMTRLTRESAPCLTRNPFE